MVRKFRGIWTGILGVSLLFSSLGTAAAQTVNEKDYEGHWAQKTIQSWLDSGLLKGFEDGSVKPNQTITRAEFMALVNRSYHFTEQGVVNFSDVPSTSWAYIEISKAVAAGYIQGFNSKMRPNAPINRQEAAVIISKLLKLDAGNIEVLNVFSDAGQIASWSKGSVAAAVTAGVLKGYPNGTFAPQQSLTRAESMSLIDAAATVKPSIIVEPTPLPVASPSPSPTPTATVAVAVGGGGGGGGVVPEVTSTPAQTPTPLAIPFVNGVRITASEEVRVSNAANLTIDFSLVPDEIGLKIDHFDQYITNGPIPVEQLLSEDLNHGHIDIFPKSMNYYINAYQLQGITDPYITQIYYDVNNQPIGYFREKTKIELMTVTKSELFSQITDGVTFSKVSVGENVYAIRIDVSEVFEQKGNHAVYYSVDSHQTNTEAGDSGPLFDDILSGSNYLYRQDDQNVMMGYSPDSDYYVVFYDRNLHAISYYMGDWTKSEQQALESTISRIKALPDATVLSLADEDAVTGALRKFDSLSDDQKLKVSMEEQNKLSNAVAVIGRLRPLGNLGYPYFNAVASADTNYLNSSSFMIDVQNLPSLIRYTSVKFSYTTSTSPIGKEFLINQGEDYKFDLRDRVNLFIKNPHAGIYLNIVLYDKQGKITAYYSEPLNLPVLRAVWDFPVPQITDGVVIKKSDDGRAAEIDVRGYLNQTAQAAKYYTVTSQIKTGNTEFSPETWLSSNDISYLYNTKQQVVNTSNTWDNQQYLVIFYDRDLKVLGYYQGKAEFTERQLIDLAQSRLSQLPAADKISIDDEHSVEEARWAYEALTKSQQQQFDASYLQRLEQAETRVNELHSLGSLSSIPRVGGVTRTLEFPGMLNGTFLSVEFQLLPQTVANLAISFNSYLTDQPISQDDLNSRMPNNQYQMGYGGYTLFSPALPGEKYVTLVFYDKNKMPIAYNTEKIEFKVKKPLLDASVVELMEGVQISRSNIGTDKITTIDVSELINNKKLEISYYTVNTKRELGGEAGFNVEKAVQYRNFVKTNDKIIYSDQDEQEYLILFYDENYKVLYYYKSND